MDPRTQYDSFITLKDIELTLESKIFQNLVLEIGFAKNIISSFDNWLTFKLPKQIENLQFPIPNGEGLYTFRNIKYQKPTYQKSKEILYPRDARLRGETYFIVVKADIIFFNKDGSINATRSTIAPEGKEQQTICKIPLILGSRYCHLYGLTSAQKAAVGECFSDPLGYFIIKGAEKVVIIQEKLATSQFMTYKSGNKRDLESRITCLTVSGSTINRMLIGKKWATLKVSLQSLGKKHAPLMVLFDILLRNIYSNKNEKGETILLTHNQIINASLELVLKFVLPEHRERIYYALLPSFSKYKETIPSAYEYMIEKHNKINKTSLAGHKGKVTLESGLNKMEYLQMIVDDVYKDLFSHVPNAKKHTHLAYMTSQMLMTFLGLRPIDNRDGWEDKRLVPSSNSMEQLFNAIWLNEKKTIAKSFEKDVARLNVSFNTRVTDNFVSSFGSNSWGAKNSHIKENIVEAIKRETPTAIYSLIGVINTPASRQAKQPMVRQLQRSGTGYICIVETPEGSGIGLVKNHASTCWIEEERDRDKLIVMISNLPGITYKEDYTETTVTPVFLNGEIIFWCDHTIVEPILRKLKFIRTNRNERPDFFDICIVYNRGDRVLEIYTDGGRPCRPLFTVIEINDQLRLTIDVLREANPTVDFASIDIFDLVEAGAIEFVHAREQDYTLIAEFPEYVRNFSADIQRVREELDNDDTKKVKLASARLKLTPEEFSTMSEHGLKPITDPTILGKLSPEEIELFRIGFLNEAIRSDKEKFLTRKKYTHSEINPQSIFGVVGDTMPAANFNQGPRLSYQASMIKQALGLYHSQEHNRWDTGYKKLITPSPPLFKTEIARSMCLDIMPTGDTPIVAFLSRRHNNEDAIIMKKEFLDIHFRLIKYTTHRINIKKSNGVISEVITRPPGTANDPNGLYGALDENGMPRVGAYIRQGDYIIGRVRNVTNAFGVTTSENISIKAGVGKEGYVDRIYINDGADGNIIIRIKIRQVRTQGEGDKFASRYAQKGVCGEVVEEKYLPHIVGGPNDSIVPDFFVNPASLITRMTCGMMHEIIASKAALYDGKYINATAFEPYDIEYYRRILQDNGMDPDGFETMALPNGKILEVPIFCGPYYYQSLRHHVYDKFQVRSTGGIVPLTRQPVRGRDHEGGLRFGEQEHDAMISHGCTALLLERLMISSDEFGLFYCSNCGNIAVINHSLSKIQCRVCPDGQEKFGNIKIPYIYLLITRMLLAIGVHTSLKFETIAKIGQIEEDLLIQ